jgi:uncharacterized damage-inducible protein DinB
MIATLSHFHYRIDPYFRAMANTLVNNFIRQLNEIENGSPWFDQSFMEKLDILPEAIAFARPVPGVHSVAEHVSHMVEWRKECIRRFSGRKYDLMHAPEDWKNDIELKNIGWGALKASLYESTLDMIGLIEGKDDAYLETVFQDTEYTYKYLVEGIIHHDIYHLGQIGVTLRLLQMA